MSSAVGLTTQIYNNHIKSAFLLAGFPVLLALMMGGFFTALAALTQYGATAHAGRKPHIDWAAALHAGTESIVQYGHWAALAAGVWFVIAYFFQARIVRLATGAKPVTRQEYPELYNMLENLCISRGLPVPMFELIDSPALNAFASGIDRKSYRIVLTRGLAETLPKDELEGVIAHELTHIMNGDVRLLIIAVVFVGIISFLTQMVFRGLTRGVSRRSDKKGGALAIMLVAMAILVIGYLLATVIRFALSRKREYLADAGAVELTKNPEAMMRALLRIAGRDRVENMPEGVQQMCIENSRNFMGLFATHPPVADRVKTISGMTNTAVPAI
jgi:heat shock protein HtpX